VDPEPVASSSRLSRSNSIAISDNPTDDEEGEEDYVRQSGRMSLAIMISRMFGFRSAVRLCKHSSSQY
jgi:hypothetical protein